MLYLSCALVFILALRCSECIPEKEKSKPPQKKKDATTKQKLPKGNKKAKISKGIGSQLEYSVQSQNEAAPEKDEKSSICSPDAPDMSKEILARKERRRRFKLDEVAQVSATSTILYSSSQPSEKLFESDDFDIIRGTSTNLEKSYLRLTSVSKILILANGTLYNDEPVSKGSR